MLRSHLRILCLVSLAVACVSSAPEEPRPTNNQPTSLPTDDNNSSVLSDPMVVTVSDAARNFPGAGSIRIQETPVGTEVTLSIRGPSRAGEFGNLIVELPLTVQEARDLGSGLTVRPNGQFAAYPVSVSNSDTGGYVLRAIESVVLQTSANLITTLTLELGLVSQRLGSQRSLDPNDATLVAQGNLNLSCGRMGMQAPGGGYSMVYDVNFSSDFCRNAIRDLGLAALAANVGHPIE